MKKEGLTKLSKILIIVIVIILVFFIYFLFTKIFKSGPVGIGTLNEEMQNEINELFEKDNLLEKPKVVLYPPSRQIKIAQGEIGGIAISIKNRENTSGVFAYETKAKIIKEGCEITLSQAEEFIILGKNIGNIVLDSGKAMDSAILMKLRIPEDVPICEIRYEVTVTKDNLVYEETYFEIEIID